MELAGQADVPAEVDVSETGPEEPVSEGAPVTGVSEDQKLPDVHGKNVFFFQYDREGKNIRRIWWRVLSNNPVSLLSDVNLFLQHSPLLVFSLLKTHFQELVARTKGIQKVSGR